MILRPYPAPVLGSLAALKRRINTTSTGDDALLLDYLRSASSVIERDTRSFVPYRTAYRVQPEFNAQRLYLLPDDPLHIDQVTSGETVHGYRQSGRYLEVAAVGAVDVAGVWGYGFSQALLAPVGTLQHALTADETEIALSAPVGFPDYWVIGNHAADEELVAVQAVDAVAERVTVARGQRGYATRAYPSGTPVWRVQVPADVVETALKFAQHLYNLRDGEGEQVHVSEGIVTYSGQTPRFVRDTVQRYAYDRPEVV